MTFHVGQLVNWAFRPPRKQPPFVVLEVLFAHPHPGYDETFASAKILALEPPYHVSETSILDEEVVGSLTDPELALLHLGQYALLATQVTTRLSHETHPPTPSR